AQDWCADIQSAAFSRQPVHTGDGPICSGPDVDIPVANNRGDQHLMFVGVGKSFQPADSLRTLPATVRLVATDDCPLLLRNTGKPSGHSIPELRPGGRHWEVNPFRFFGTGFASGFDESPGEMVKGRPEVLDGIPEAQAAIRPDRWETGDLDQAGRLISSCLDLYLKGEGVEVRIKAPLKGRVYGLHVLTR